MQTRTNHRKETEGRKTWTRHTHSRRAPRASITDSDFTEAGGTPDFALVREVQMRATGANIHALAQQLQIYVSAVECGAVLHAKAAEAQLRSWLAARR